MVESSTIFLIAFFGVAIAGTPFAVKWLSDRNKGTNSEKESYEKFKQTEYGKVIDQSNTKITPGISDLIDYINKNKRD